MLEHWNNELKPNIPLFHYSNIPLRNIPVFQEVVDSLVGLW